MFDIEYTASALLDISTFRKHEQTTIFDRVYEQLTYQPDLETRNRKRLRPNDIAQWELRIDNYRVLYDVDNRAKKVEVRLAGLKQGSTLLVRGKEYRL